MSGTVTIETLATADFPIVAQWLSEPEINQWLSSDWRGQTVDPTLIAVAVRNRKNRFYLVRCDGEACGLVALGDLDLTDRIAMIWYVLGNKDVEHRGITTSAVRELVRAAFNEMELESLHAWVMADNTASGRVLEKAGFKEVGRLRSAASHNGKRLDRIYFDKTRFDADPP